MTALDAPEFIAFALLACLALRARDRGFRFSALSTILGLAVMQLSAIRAGLEYGNGIGGPVVVAIAASVIGAAHLLFRFTVFGLAIGMLLAAIVFASGAAIGGLLPITYRQGLGLDYWTIYTVLNYAAISILGFAIVRRGYGHAR